MSDINLELPFEKIVSFRHTLHQFPEVSEFESETAKRVVDFVKNFNPDGILENLGGTGVAVVYNGEKPGPTLLFRCELDALPIQEINEFQHRSVYQGISHKCGHDGHMAILVGLASLLKNSPPETGRIVLLFQPAEENGAGAKAVLADARFADIEPDMVFALHNLPGYPENHIFCKSGSFTPAVTSIIIRLTGKTSHAAEPENGINPALAMSVIIREFHNLECTDQKSEKFGLITPVEMNMGEEAYGISAGYGELRYTLRTWTNSQLEQLKKSTEEVVAAVADNHGLSVEVEWTQTFAANENHDEMVSLIKESAQENQLHYVEKTEPFKWGEDFGLFTEKYKGAMFGIGAGEKVPALHNPDYDFPDQIIPAAVNMFYKIIQKVAKHV